MKNESSMHWRRYVLIALLFMLASPLVIADTLIIEGRTRGVASGGGSGNVSSVTAGDGLQNTGSAVNPILRVDTTVCRSNGTNCQSGGNASWNESYANTLYYPRFSNPQGYLTSETDPIWTAASSSVARTGTCSAGFVVQNTTTGGVQCVADKDTTYTNGTGVLLTGNQFNATLASFTTDNLAQGATNKYDNTSWTQALADTLYYAITNPRSFVNLSQINANMGNWSADKPLYALNSRVDAVNATAQGLNATKAVTGTCAAGFVTQNISNTSYQCVNVTTQIADIYLFNTGDTGTGNYSWTGNHTFGASTPTALFVDATNGRIAIGTSLFSSTNPETLLVNSSGTVNPLSVVANVDNYAQVKIKNLNNGSNASSDFVAEANNGDDNNYFVDLGVNGQNYSVASWSINGKNDAYLYAQNGSLAIGTSTSGMNLTFFAGGLLASNEAMRITSSQQVILGNETLIGTGLDQAKLQVRTFTNSSGIATPAGLLLQPRIEADAIGMTGVQLRPQIAPRVNIGGNVFGVNFIPGIMPSSNGSRNITTFSAQFLRYDATGGYNGTLSTGRAIFIANPTLASAVITLNQALYIANQSAGTTNYAVYADGTTQSYFGGNVGIATTAPASALDVNGSAIIRTGGAANKAVCWKADGITLGKCTTAVDASGGCTCA